MVRAVAGDDAWEHIDGALIAGRISLRDALAQQAALVRMTRPEALAFLETRATVDPAFASFVAAVRAHGGRIAVLSSGIAPVIEDALARAGVAVDVYANDVDFDPAGWTIAFRDDSMNGHDKAAHVRRANAAGDETVYIGDGISDFEAAVIAGRRFAKAGRALERYCRERAIACDSFSAFAEIERTLFG